MIFGEYHLILGKTHFHTYHITKIKFREVYHKVVETAKRD